MKLTHVPWLLGLCDFMKSSKKGTCKGFEMAGIREVIEHEWQGRRKILRDRTFNQAKFNCLCIFQNENDDKKRYHSFILSFY